jgi:predicted nucleotidyltransferase
MLEKTAGLADAVRSALAPLRSRIDVAVIYGSVASRQERSSSDVDLMVIGKATLLDLAVVLRPLEQELARSVNVSVYTTQEFRKRLKEKNHFLTSVMETELIFILGKQYDLERLVEGATHPGS